MQSREERTEQIGTKQCTTTEHFTFSLGLGTVLCHLERKIASETLKMRGGGGGGGEGRGGEGVLRTQTTLCVFVCWGKNTDNIMCVCVLGEGYAQCSNTPLQMLGTHFAPGFQLDAHSEVHSLRTRMKCLLGSVGRKLCYFQFMTHVIISPTHRFVPVLISVVSLAKERLIFPPAVSASQPFLNYTAILSAGTRSTEKIEGVVITTGKGPNNNPIQHLKA